MRSERRVEIICTDGATTMRLFWLEQRKSGIYGSFFIPGLELHRSYHLDGKVHFFSKSIQRMDGGQEVFKPSGYSKEVVTAQPLSSFRGRFDFFSGGHRLDPDVYKEALPYKFKKANHFILVDSRNISGGQKHVNLFVNLLEAGSCESINEALQGFESIRRKQKWSGEYHLYSDFLPWVLIFLMYESK